MDTSGEYLIAMPPDRVWAALGDPALLRACIPGCRVVERLPPNRLRGTVDIKLAGTPTEFTMTLTSSDAVAPRSCTLVVDGDGALAGSVRATLATRLAAEGSGTRVSYSGQVEAKSGSLVELTPGLVETTAKQIADRFFAALSSRISDGRIARAELVVGEAAHEVVEVAREAEERAEVAAGRGFLGGAQMWAIIALAVVIVLLIISRL
jgi:carbon monoxide dehydrogenase subunit G